MFKIVVSLIFVIFLNACSVKVIKNQKEILSKKSQNFTIEESISLSEKVSKQISDINDINEGLPKNEIGIQLLPFKIVARNLYQKGDYKKAIEVSEKALTLSLKYYGEANRTTIMIMADLATYYQSQGLYEKSESLYRKMLTSEPNDTAIMNNLVVLYESEGRYDLAEKYAVKVVALRKINLGENHPETVLSIANLAAVYEAQGQYELAENLYQEAFKKLPLNDRNRATLENNMADLYMTQGRYQLAEKYYNNALKLKDENHPEAIVTLSNLAENYTRQKRYDISKPLHQKSLALSEKALGKNHPLTLNMMNNLALFYCEIQDNLCEKLTRESFELRSQILGEEHPETLVSMSNLAAFYRKSHVNYDITEKFNQKTLQLFNKVYGEKHYRTLMVRRGLALVYQQNNQLEKATELWKENLRLSNKTLEKLLWGSSEKTRQSYLQQEKRNVDNLLSFYSAYTIPDEAFYFSLSRKGLLLRISSEFNLLSKHIADSEIKKLAESFKEKKQQIGALDFSNNKNSYSEKISEEINALEMQLSQKLNGFRKQIAEVTPEQLVAKLNDKKILVDFLVYDEIGLKTLKPKTQQLIALVVDKKGIKLVKLGEMQPITQAIQAYHQVIEPKGETVRERMDSLKDATRKQILTANAQALYRKIWQPLLGYLGDKKEIYVIPDGALNVFPMKAMQDETGHYLAENYSLKLLSSARDIVLPPGNNGSSQASAIFAGVYYDDQQVAEAKTIEQAEQIVLDKQQAEAAQAKGETVAKKRGDLKFPYLKKSFGEGLAIQAQMKTTQQAVNFFSGFAASEAAIKQVKSPRFLVLSTHGFFLEDQPAPRLEQAELLSARGLLDNPFNVSAKLQDNPLTRSGLAFARANDSAGITDSYNDGVLTALEVLGLDLENTDLVTLSACQTALGNIQVGEGVYSLNRAFQEAGAKAVLSTLWKVDDEKTQAFMQRFYAEVILNHVPVQQALQQTQINFITDAERPKIHQDPYFWAAFSMVGL